MSYVGMIATGTAAILAAALFCVAHTGIGGWMLIVLGVAGSIPASDVAIAVVNRAITQLVGAAFLPGLELRDGVPPEVPQRRGVTGHEKLLARMSSSMARL